MDEKENIICDKCKLAFERIREFKYCSNCFACTGCEIYYCPRCDNEILIKPVQPMNAPEQEVKRKKNSQPR